MRWKSYLKQELVLHPFVLAFAQGLLKQYCWVFAAPVISMPPQDVQNFTGNDVIFGCEVSAYPMPHLEWKKKGNKMFLPGDDAHISVQVKTAFFASYGLQGGVGGFVGEVLPQDAMLLQ